MMTVKELANLFDHTLLRADATREQFKVLCEDSAKYGFKMVAINSAQCSLCREYLGDSGVHVGAAVGFPLGQTTIEVKVFETEDAIRNGADEIDYVVNLTELKAGNYDYVKREMEEIVKVCREHDVISKVIFENCYLTEEEKKTLCRIALEVKPDFIKTSTGFGTGGATLEDVRLMKSMVGETIKVKAAGGIRDLETCLAFVEAGAERIGTSASIHILEEYEKSMG